MHRQRHASGKIIVKPTTACPIEISSDTDDESSKQAWGPCAEGQWSYEGPESTQTTPNEEGESSHSRISDEEAAAATAMSSMRQRIADYQEHKQQQRQIKLIRRSNPPEGKKWCAGYCQFCPEEAFAEGKATCNSCMSTPGMCIRFMRNWQRFNIYSDIQLLQQAERYRQQLIQFRNARVMNSMVVSAIPPTPSMFVEDNAHLLGDLVHQDPTRYSEPEPPGTWSMTAMAMATTHTAENESVSDPTTDDDVFNQEELAEMSIIAKHHTFAVWMQAFITHMQQHELMRTWAFNMLMWTANLVNSTHAKAMLHWWRYVSSGSGPSTLFSRRWWSRQVHQVAADLGNADCMAQLERIGRMRAAGGDAEQYAAQLFTITRYAQSNFRVYGQEPTSRRRRTGTGLFDYTMVLPTLSRSEFTCTGAEKRWIVAMLQRFDLPFSVIKHPVNYASHRNHNRLLHFLMAPRRFRREVPTWADTKSNLARINAMFSHTPSMQPANHGNGRNACVAMQKLIQQQHRESAWADQTHPARMVPQRAEKRQSRVPWVTPSPPVPVVSTRSRKTFPTKSCKGIPKPQMVKQTRCRQQLAVAMDHHPVERNGSDWHHNQFLRGPPAGCLPVE